MTVKQKQCLLYYLGYYTGEIDGLWGSGSSDATRRFQGDFGLQADGIFGDATAKAAKHAVAYGMPEKKPESNKPDSSKPSTSGDWWDDIKYFKKSEFACKCGKYCNGYPVEMDKTVVKAADKVRFHFNAPVTVSSGMRCDKHNANVGGVSNSRHKLGKAIDFCVKGKSASQVLAYVNTLSEIRYAYAIDGSYVHMDVN